MGKAGAANKVYAVRVGRTGTGIYHSWDACRQQVHRFPGAQFKSFGSEAQAQAYVGYQEGQAPAPAPAAPREQRAALPAAARDACSSIQPHQRYRLEWDGGARGNPGPAGAGAVLYNDESSTEVGSVCVPLGRATNNVAEYRGLISGLEAARDMGVRRLHVRGDSMLVVNQVTGTWQVRHEGLQPLHKQATELSRGFDEFSIGHVPREANKVADALSNMAMDGGGWKGLRDPQGRTWLGGKVDASAKHDSTDDPAPATKRRRR